MKKILSIVLLGASGLLHAAQVTDVTATAIDGASVAVSWSADMDAGYYDLYQDSGAAFFTGITDTSFVVRGLAADTAYQFFVTSCDSSGMCSAASAQADVTTLAGGMTDGKPCDVSGGDAVLVVTYKDNGSGTADLMWCGVAGAEGYNLFFNNDYVTTYGSDVQRATVEWVDGYEYQVAWFGNGEFPAKSAVATNVDGAGEPPLSSNQLVLKLDAESRNLPDTVEVYFTRHAEKQTELMAQDDGSYTEVCGAKKCSEVLNSKGELRAQLLAKLFMDAGITNRLTHAFSSHKTRTRQTIAQIALDAGLSGDVDKNSDDGIQEFPVLNDDSTANATELDPESTSGSEQPTIDALLDLPSGSVVLVAGHSGTLYDIMAGLGLDDTCSENTIDTCNQDRYPVNSKFKVKNYGDIWKLTIANGEAAFVYRTNLQPVELEAVNVAQ